MKQPLNILRSIFLAAVVTSSLVTSTAHAFDQDFYSGNDILFSRPDAVKCVDGAGAVSLAGNDNIEKGLNFFMQKGLNLAQAAGIIGNFVVESGMVPNNQQNGTAFPHKAWGIAQWDNDASPDRRAKLAERINAAGLSQLYNGDEKKLTPEENDALLGVELEFAWSEMPSRSDTLTKVKATNDPQEAAYVFHKYFEGSADSEAAIRKNRGGKAQELYDQFSDAPPLAGSTTATGSTDVGQTPAPAASSACGSSAATGNFAQTLLSYAWPTYKGLDDKSTDGYQAAWAKVGPGNYTGARGNSSGDIGIDCGAFVTRLIVDSGFDPSYNYGGKTAAGAGATSTQMKWLQDNWQNLGRGGSFDVSTLQPGDVAIKDGHTFVYVGDVPGFGAKIASASLGERAPMADTAQNAADSNFTWFRKK